METIGKLVKDGCKNLRASARRLEDIYRISFAEPKRTMAQYTQDGAMISMSYGEVDALSDLAALRLLEKNKESGRFVGLFAENCAGWLVLFWAILKSGNKPYLINTVQPKSFIGRILSTLKVDTVLYIGAAPGLAAIEINYEELVQKGKSDAGTNTDRLKGVGFGNEIALTTSGTTLEEKICIYSGEEIAEQILNCEQIFRENREILTGDHGTIRMLMLLPLYHIFGLEAGFLWYIIFRSTFVFLSDQTPASILETIRERKVTHVYAVPLFWRTVEKEFKRRLRAKPQKEQEEFGKAIKESIRLQSLYPRRGNAYAKRAFQSARKELFGDRIRYCISGGSRLNDSTLEFFNALGYPLCNGYGMSEIGIGSVELSHRFCDRIKNSIGKPFASVNYRIDEDGILKVSGSSICKHLYIGGVKKEPSEWFSTGDLMKCDGDGRYYFCGRGSDLVFGDAGEKLNPELVEKEFDLPGATAFSVLGDEQNEKLILVVQIQEGLLEFQKKQIRTACEICNQKLPAAYRVQKVFFTVCPLVFGGVKVSRARLRAGINDGSVVLFEDCGRSAPEDANERDEVKEILASMIAEVLSIDPAEVRDDAHFFYDLGGSSLDYLTLISMIDNRFDITMNFEEKGAGYSLNELTQGVKNRLCC
ncbi:MAG: AMP-binding protein [Clostridia bacterium]|nr:AMP-binding protein [Clostridia bacterium]